MIRSSKASIDTIACRTRSRVAVRAWPGPSIAELLPRYRRGTATRRRSKKSRPPSRTRPGRARNAAVFGSGREAGGADAPQASRRRGPRTPLAVTPPEAPARRVAAAEGGLRTASHKGRSRAKPGLARAGSSMSLAALPRGGGSPPSGARTARPAAQRSSCRTEVGARRLRVSGTARKGPRLRPFAASSARHVACTRPHAARRAVQAPARPARRLSACHGACMWARCRAPGTPRATREHHDDEEDEDDDEGGTDESGSERKKAARACRRRRGPRRHRRRGDRKGSAISGTPRSGPQAVKDARSARLVEPVP